MDKKQKEILDNQSYLVVKNNELAQNLRYSLENPDNKILTVLEQRIFLYLVSKIKPKQNKFEWEEFSIPEFCRTFRIKEDSNYTTIKKTIRAMASRALWLVDKEENKDILVRLIERARIDRNKGTIQLKLDDEMAPYLLNQLKGFYKYPLISVINFKCKYSFMLFEIFCSYANYKRTIEYDIDDLKQRFGCENYNITNFKTKVIDRAILEINEHTVFTVNYEWVKDGKQIKSIIFKINEKQPIEVWEQIYDEISNNTGE